MTPPARRPVPRLLPTSVIGSHALPGWFWTALEAIKEQKYGQTDVREVMDDAVNAAIRDQERAGIDLITDGEMRRWYFVQGFYSLFTGLEQLPPLRTQGVYGYDSPPRYRLQARVAAPGGLGIVGSRPRGRRRYKWMFPDLLETEADQLVLEFANREMVELELLGEIVRGGKDAAAGVVDVKSFYVETPEDVAERVRACLA